MNELDQELLRAASQGNLDRVNELLEKGASVHAQEALGDTALNQAAYGGHLAVVQRLVEAGADIENVGASDQTPIMNAAFASRVKVVEFLLTKGALVNHDLLSSIQLKVNILTENAEAGMVQPQAVEAWTWFLKLLQLAQLKQVKPSTGGSSPADAQLLQAAYAGNVDDLNKAIQSGANPNASDGQDIAALRWAAQNGHVEAVKILLGAGANVNQQSQSGWTALMQSVLAEQLAIVTLLIEQGAEVNAKTFANATALYFARDVVQFAADEATARRIITLLEQHGAE